MEIEGEDEIGRIVRYERHIQDVDPDKVYETGTSEIREVLAERIKALGLTRSIDENLN